MKALLEVEVKDRFFVLFELLVKLGCWNFILLFFIIFFNVLKNPIQSSS